MEGIEDMFQLEVMEEVHAFNICVEEFDTNDKLKNHVEKYHKDILVNIRNNMEEAADSSSDESCGDAWLSRHDDDGNFIG